MLHEILREEGESRRIADTYFFFQAKNGIRVLVRSRGPGMVYKRQGWGRALVAGGGGEVRCGGSRGVRGHMCVVLIWGFWGLCCEVCSKTNYLPRCELGGAGLRGWCGLFWGVFAVCLVVGVGLWVGVCP